VSYICRSHHPFLASYIHLLTQGAGGVLMAYSLAIRSQDDGDSLTFQPLRFMSLI